MVTFYGLCDGEIMVRETKIFWFLSNFFAKISARVT